MGYHMEGLKELSSIYVPIFHEAISSRGLSLKVPTLCSPSFLGRQCCWKWQIEGVPWDLQEVKSRPWKSMASCKPKVLSRESTGYGDCSLQVEAGTGDRQISH